MKYKAVYVEDITKLRRLEQYSVFLMHALGERPYLVGSVIETPEYRDVDVRMIFDDEKFVTLFGDINQELSSFWQLLCTSVSMLLREQTGLPIDFQIQRRSKVKEADWAKPRYPLGLFPYHDSPAWKTVKTKEKEKDDKESI